MWILEQVWAAITQPDFDESPAASTGFAADACCNPAAELEGVSTCRSWGCAKDSGISSEVDWWHVKFEGRYYIRTGPGIIQQLWGVNDCHGMTRERCLRPFFFLWDMEFSRNDHEREGVDSKQFDQFSDRFTWRDPAFVSHRQYLYFHLIISELYYEMRMFNTWFSCCFSSRCCWGCCC